MHEGFYPMGSHYGKLLSIINLFSSVVGVLEIIIDDGLRFGQKKWAKNLLKLMLSFNFVFYLHLIRDILGITNELSQALEKKDQDLWMLWTWLSYVNNNSKWRERLDEIP